MTASRELLFEGRRLLNRHFYGDGRWGVSYKHPRTSREVHSWARWRVTKHRPHKTIWAMSTHRGARKVHAIRYALRAQHVNRQGEPDGCEVHLTVWVCGEQVTCRTRRISNPKRVCARCQAKLDGTHEVPYTPDDS